MVVCYSCGRPLELDEKIQRQEVCPYCRADLHCCLNCGLYDDYAHNKCHEPLAEWVSDRENNNFCEYFFYQESGTTQNKLRDRDEARAKLEALFRKKS